MRRRSGLALVAVLAGALALPAATTPEAAFVGSWSWKMDYPFFGGFSGIEISPDGQGFAALGDRGFLFQGRLTRTDGRVDGVTDVSFIRLRDEQGEMRPYTETDAEGLAIREGQVVVSFEGLHRVSLFDGAGTETRLPVALGFHGLQPNSGLEALAVDDQGRLYAIAERSGALTLPFPVWRWDGSEWRIVFSLPRTEGFLPVGADVGPDGRLYVLERAFGGFAFRSRVRRFALDGSGEETLLETPILRHQNLEGLSVWRDAAGDLRLTMIADDNFHPLLSTEIVEYRLR